MTRNEKIAVGVGESFAADLFVGYIEGHVCKGMPKELSNLAARLTSVHLALYYKATPKNFKHLQELAACSARDHVTKLLEATK